VAAVKADSGEAEARAEAGKSLAPGEPGLRVLLC